MSNPKHGKNKLKVTGFMQDPYSCLAADSINEQQKRDWLNWPDVEYPDILNYFIATPSLCTKQELRA